MPHCRSCNAEFEPFISFGQMPIANGFLLPEQFADEYFFELAVGFCSKCSLVQLVNQPDREMMFNDHYAFYSSTSAYMAQHFGEFAQAVAGKHLSAPDPLVVEIGSNDGIMLRNFAAKGIRHVGIEPSANVAAVAQAQGVNTIAQFFDEELAAKIVNEYGQADAFMGANVFCHIPYFHSVAAGIKKLLKPKGVLVFEEPYMGDILEKTSYDQIYDEHVFFFTVASVSNFFAQHELEVFDVSPQKVHGGSMRYSLGHVGAHPISESVVRQRAYEKVRGLDQAQTYQALRKNIEQSRDALRSLLVDMKQRGKRVVGYGATSKSTTVTNYCQITPDLVEFISDTTPIKQGKYSPGVHIPVKPYEDFVANYPDYALLFAWNHAAEILAREKNFGAAGGEWLMFVPKVETLSYDLVRQP
jgi:methylation protein EvaC